MAEDTQAENKAQPIKFYAAMLLADGLFTVEEFDAVQELVDRLKELIDKDVSVFTFAGSRIHISKPPMRFLMMPDDNIPLFDIKTDNIEPDDTGYLGLDPTYFEDPPEIKTPKKANKNSSADDFFSDPEDTTFGVFDGILPDPNQ